jgi:hypothetical protein
LCEVRKMIEQRPRVTVVSILMNGSKSSRSPHPTHHISSRDFPHLKNAFAYWVLL